MALPQTIGRYEILGPIGSGGMGTVLRARDPRIGGRTVAIKLLRKGIQDDEIRRRFMQEANAAGVLEHENIVRVFDVGEQDGEPFIAMEFIDGETLSHWIRRKEPAAISRKLRLMEDLCDGLAYAHTRGVVHRDVKPSNLIVERRRGRLKILDFGIAKLPDSGLTQSGVLIGSFNYMSPEQLQGQPIDHRSDIFSVGAVMFELLSYKQAFPGGIGDGVISRITEQAAPRLRQLIPDAEPELEQIIEKALEKDPSRRYPDLTAMLRDVTRVRRRLDDSSGETEADASHRTAPPADVARRTPMAAPNPARLAGIRAERVSEHLDAASRAFETGRFDAAIEHANRAAALAPEDARVATLLRDARAALDAREVERHIDDARARLGAGDLDGAAACLDRAREIQPDHESIQPLRAEVAATRTRDGLRAVLARARAALEAGDTEAAIHATVEAELYEPGNQDARAIRHEADERQRVVARREADGAEAERRSSEEKAASEGTSLQRRQAVVDAMLADAAARFESGDYAGAIVRCDAALRIDPARKQALRLRQDAVAARQAGLKRVEALADAARVPAADDTSAGFVLPQDSTVFGGTSANFPPPLPDVTVLGTSGGEGPPARATPSDDADHSVLLRVPVDAQTGPSAVLIVAESPDWQLRHRRVAVTIPRFEIGRGRQSGLALTDPQVSRTHVVIELVDGDFIVRDESSANGTFLNGRRLPPGIAEPLVFGTSLRVGSTVLLFSYGRDTTLPDLTQATVERRYTLEGLIRQSMQGAVYAARDRNTHTRVAIKLTSPDLFRHSAYRRQFEREVEMVSQLDHPHISRVIDSYSEADVRPLAGPPLRMPALCYVLFDGGTLQDVIDAKAEVPRDQIARWVVQVADALDHAHQHQIVHASLKPTAIVFDRTRTHPYLSDFAIAHRLAGDGAKPPVAGTPTFMAPEQWEGGALTPAVDQFALAAVAYYLVTGLRPFEAQDNPIVRQRNFLNGAPAAHDEAARNGRPDVPAAVSPVLRRGLATGPGDRFASIGAFAEAFAAALRGQARDAAPRVFFSYRREASAGWAWTFSTALRDRHGILSFVDVAQMDRAVRFPAKLEHEIRTCDVFVCFLTGNTLQSDWVRREIQLAREYGRPMVPVVDDTFVRPADLTDAALIELLEFDFVRLYGDYVDEAIDRLASRIKRTCAAAERTPVPPPDRGPDRAKGAG